MKTLKKVFCLVIVMAMFVSIASASKESLQSSMDALKDQISATGSVTSDEYSYVSVTAIAGDNSEATVYTEGTGDWLSIISSIYMETDDPVSGTANAYVSADEVSVGADASADSILNSIFLSNYIEGIGDAEGYACIYGLEKYC